MPSRSRSRSYSRSRSRSKSRSRSYSRSRSRGRTRSVSPLSNRKRHVGDREMPPPSKVIGVFGLNLDTTDRELRRVYDKYGKVDDAMIIHDRKSGMSRGFGFVYFANSDDAAVAKDETNGLEIDGKKIRVDFSVTKRPHTPTPGQYMGRPTMPRYSGGRGYSGGGGGRGYGGRGSRRSFSRSRSRSPPRHSRRYRSRSRSPPPRRRTPSRSYSRSRSRTPPRYQRRR